MFRSHGRRETAQLDEVEATFRRHRDAAAARRLLAEALVSALGGTLDEEDDVALGDYLLSTKAWLEKYDWTPQPLGQLRRKAELVSDFLAEQAPRGPDTVKDPRLVWAEDLNSRRALVVLLDATDDTLASVDEYVGSWLEVREHKLAEPVGGDRDLGNSTSSVQQLVRPSPQGAPNQLYFNAVTVKFDDWLDAGAFGGTHPAGMLSIGVERPRLRAESDVPSTDLAAVLCYWSDCHLTLRTGESCVDLLSRLGESTLNDLGIDSWRRVWSYLEYSSAHESYTLFTSLAAELSRVRPTDSMPFTTSSPEPGLWLLWSHISSDWQVGAWTSAATCLLKGSITGLAKEEDIRRLGALAGWTLKREDRFEQADYLDNGRLLRRVIRGARRIHEVTSHGD